MGQIKNPEKNPGVGLSWVERQCERGIGCFKWFISRRSEKQEEQRFSSVENGFTNRIHSRDGRGKEGTMQDWLALIGVFITALLFLNGC